MGKGKEGNERDIVILNGTSIPDCEIDITLERYTRRDWKEGRDGDDLKDLGRKSYEFHLHGTADWDTYEKLDSIAHEKQIRLEFRLGKFYVVCKKMEYRSDGSYFMVLIEDIVPNFEDDNR